MTSKTTSPLVSVVVPNYNYAQFLPARLDSIIHQTYREIEVILLDDQSTDGSVAILQRYQQQDARIRPVVVNTTNSGSPFRQWEKGIRLAQGKYVWIAEADDDADVHLLEKAVEVLESDEDMVFAKVDSYWVDTDDHILERDPDRWRKRKIQEGQIDYYDGREFVRKEQYWANRIYNASGVVFRRDAANEQSWQSLDIPNVSDWLFWSDIALKGRIAEIHYRLNRFRQQPQSLTHSANAMRTSSYNVVHVMHRIQQLVYIPWPIRLLRLRKIVKHHQGDLCSKWELLCYILSHHLLED